MSKVRIPINPMQVGRVGAYSMYVRSGEQIVRQRKNSSNYGPEASRTESQMTRRVKWSSLVNFYKVCSAWMPKAYETLKQGQTVYNKFMQLNINKATCALTKDMAQNGCCCIENWTVSQGSLSPIEYGGGVSGIGIISNIKLTTAISAVTTVKSLSEDIIATNSTFQNGDNIAMVWFRNFLDRREYPFAVCEYFEFTLDTENTALLNTTDAWNVIQSAGTTGGDFLATKAATVEANEANAFAWIHTRKVGGQLKVSTQDIYVSSDDYTDQFTGQQAVQAAIDSYGVDTEVPLDPSFSQATGVEIAYLGSRVWYEGYHNVRIERTEGGELLISGQGLSSKTIQVKFRAQGSDSYVDWTPLSVDAAGWHYIISSNGTAQIYVNGFHPCDIAVSGIEPPAELENFVLMAQKGSDEATSTGGVNQKQYNAACINYNYKSSAEYAYFYFAMRVEKDLSPSQSDFGLHNCSINNYSVTPGETFDSVRMNLSPTEPGQVCYVDYKGFIVAVFNYE